mgnify:CR=1 FL=1
MEQQKKHCSVETKTVADVYNDDERKKDICDSLHIEVKRKKPDNETVSNKCFENLQGDESVDVVRTSEDTSEHSVTVICKSLREDMPEDISHKGKRQEAGNETCSCEMSISNSVDDEYFKSQVSEPILELPDLKASSDKDRKISDDNKVGITLEGRGKNIQGFEECSTELQNKHEVKGEIVVNGVDPNTRSPDAVSESLAMKKIEDPGNDTVEIKQQLQGEEKTAAKFEHKKSEVEVERSSTELNDETHSEGEMAHKLGNDLIVKETTNCHHAIFDTDEHAASDLHVKHTKALCISVNKNELNARGNQHNSMSSDSSIVVGSNETTVEKSQFDSTETFVALKENQSVLCSKGEKEAVSSAEIYDIHKPILDDNENDELRDFENLDISPRKIKLCRQLCVERSVANTENNEFAPTPPGEESRPSHTNTSCEQISIPSCQGSSQEENDNIEDKEDRSLNKVQIARETPLTNVLSSGADQMSSSDHDHTSEQSESEIPLATRRLLARFPKKLVKTLSNPPGVVVERDAALNITSPDAALVHASKSKLTLILVALIENKLEF